MDRREGGRPPKPLVCPWRVKAERLAAAGQALEELVPADARRAEPKYLFETKDNINFTKFCVETLHLVVVSAMVDKALRVSV